MAEMKQRQPSPFPAPKVASEDRESRCHCTEQCSPLCHAYSALYNKRICAKGLVSGMFESGQMPRTEGP